MTAGTLMVARFVLRISGLGSKIEDERRVGGAPRLLHRGLEPACGETPNLTSSSRKATKYAMRK
jgi:hypothetical protein